MYRFLLFTALSLSLFTSCIKRAVNVVSYRYEIGTVEQTTLMYYIGTSLKSYFNSNILDVQGAIADEALGYRGRLFVYLSNYSTSTLYELYEEDGVCVSEEIMTFDSGETLSEDMILDVISEVKTISPSNSYNLIFGGHGTGWVTQDYPYMRVGSAGDYSLLESKEVDGLTRFIGSSTDGYMEVKELSAILEKSGETFGYILFDMCYMSNIETIYEFKDVCNNIVASPCEVMAHGFPYDTVLPKLFDNSGMSTDYVAVCQAYSDYYNYESAYKSGAVAWCQTSQLDKLADIVSQINATGLSDVDIDDLQCYEMLADNVYCDFGHYFSEACLDSSLYESFQEALDLAFPVEARLHTETFYTNLSGAAGWVDINFYTGVSTSAPSVKFRDEWSETSWVKDTNSAN